MLDYPEEKVKKGTEYSDPKFCIVISTGLNLVQPIQETSCNELKIKDINQMPEMKIANSAAHKLLSRLVAEFFNMGNESQIPNA